MGKICPNTTDRIVKWTRSLSIYDEIKTAMNPLNISKKSVKAAAFLFPLRRTLVAPIFFDPKARGSSILKKNFPSKPKGIDPIR